MDLFAAGVVFGRRGLVNPLPRRRSLSAAAVSRSPGSRLPIELTANEAGPWERKWAQKFALSARLSPAIYVLSSTKGGACVNASIAAPTMLTI